MLGLWFGTVAYTNHRLCILHWKLFHRGTLNIFGTFIELEILPMIRTIVRNLDVLKMNDLIHFLPLTNHRKTHCAKPPAIKTVLQLFRNLLLEERVKILIEAFIEVFISVPLTYLIL